MGKYKAHPLAKDFETRLSSKDWAETIGTRVAAERDRRSRARLRFAGVLVFLATALLTVSTDVWEEDAAESHMLTMIDEASGDLTSQSLTRFGEWFE